MSKDGGADVCLIVVVWSTCHRASYFSEGENEVQLFWNKTKQWSDQTVSHKIKLAIKFIADIFHV